jgi:excisionase family DNA binding protein
VRALRKIQPKKKPSVDQILESDEAAEFLKVGKSHLQRHSAPHGKIPCIRIGRSVRYSVEALRAFVEKGGSK